MTPNTADSAAHLLSLFDDERKPNPPERPEPARALRPAEARLVATHDPDPNDDDHRPLLHLVVTRCPYCEHQHIHPAGHVGEPRLCIRNSRCIGQTNGAYYFPAVHQ